MKFAVKTAPQHADYTTIRDIWRAADEIDVFDSAWVFDHFYPLVGDTHGPCLEGWVLLTALAVETKRLRIGSMVNGLPYRHPAVIANMAATLDIVSEGRLQLGLGAGWNEEEANAYGIDLGHPMRVRMDRFDEAVQIVKSLLANESTDWKGEHFTLKDARCEPKGPQRPHPPIVIGGRGEKRTLRTAARFADHWNLPFATPDVFVQKNEVFLAHCADVGRDPAEVERSVQIAWQPDADPNEMAAQAAALGDVGVETVLFTLRNPYAVDPVEPLAKALQAI